MTFYAVLAFAASAGFFAQHAEWLDVIRSFWPHLSLAMIATCLIGASILRDARLLLFVAFPGLLLALTLSPLQILSGGDALAKAAAGPKIKLVSFNVLGTNDRRGRDIADFLVEARADFAFVLEARPVQRHKDRLLDQYPHIAGCGQKKPRHFCDLILLSRHPLRNVRRPRLATGIDRLVIAETTVSGRPLTLVGVHLTKPLHNTAQRREIEALAPLIASLPRPIVVAGDFNATPWSYAMSTLTAGAEIDFTYGYRPTWPVWTPTIGIPIDHVLTAGSILTRDVTTLRDSLGSNHRPLVATLTLPPQ
jgi:endonuclease/exonuclease/phosphatase (EEP) superfamily protein YafD